jgi:hypothetical protein
MATNPTLVRADALNLTTDLAQAGAVYNDATRLLDGGLWSKPADSNDQQSYLGMYTTDITAVSDDIAAMLGNPAGMTIGGTAYTPSTTDIATLTEIQSQLQSLLTAAPNAVGSSHSAVNAQETLHTVQTEILNETAGDPALATALGNVSYLSGTGANNVGFQTLPTGADDAAALAAAKAPDATLATIGQVFNAAADLATGGLNHTNLGEFNQDMAAISHGLTNILNNPTELAQIEAGEDPTAAALTTIHLQTVSDQIELQTNKFDTEYASNPNVAAHSTNDNLLDIIDIVQNDANLNTAAGGNGNPGSVGGFAELPSYLDGTITHYQDNQPQTNFWGAFLSEANVINNQLQSVAAGQETPDQINQLISQIETYQKFGANFDQSQGGIFGARFDNELLSGTLLADTKAAVQGLTGIAHGDAGAALAADQAQILAAGMGFSADAQDVSGNNNPIGGGSYVGTATTVATATSVNGIAQGTIPVTANPVVANRTGAAGAGGNGASGGQVAGNGSGSQQGHDSGPLGHDSGAHTIADVGGQLLAQFAQMWHHG